MKNVEVVLTHGNCGSANKEDEKTCNKCKVCKPITSFYKDKESADGRNGICGKCKEEQFAIRMKKNALTSVSKIPARHSKKYSEYKKSAKKRDIKFELTHEQFSVLLKGQCYLCGDFDKIGVDRVDNTMGYSANNCKPCCQECNTLKWDFTESQLLSQVEKIIRKELFDGSRVC